MEAVKASDLLYFERTLRGKARQAEGIRGGVIDKADILRWMSDHTVRELCVGHYDNERQLSLSSMHCYCSSRWYAIVNVSNRCVGAEGKKRS